MKFIKILEDIKAENEDGKVTILKKGELHKFEENLDNSGDPEWPLDLYIKHNRTGESLIIPPYQGNEQKITIEEQ